MSISLLVGSAQSNKIKRAIKHLNCAEAEALVICATAAQEGDIGRSFAWNADGESKDVKLAESEASESLGEKACRLRVQTFSSFASDLWNRWGDSRSLVGSAIRLKTIGEVLDFLLRENTEVSPSLFSAGGRNFLSRLAASFVPQRKQGKEKQLEHAVNNHDKVIRTLLNNYHEALKSNGYIEHQCAMQILAEQMREGKIALDSSAIVIVGFRDFTPSQLKLITAIAGFAKAVVVLDWEEGNPATDYLGNTVKLLLENGAELVKSPDDSPDDSPDGNTDGNTDNKDSSAAELRWLASNFLKGDGGRTPPHFLESRALAIGKAQGRDAEIALMLDFAEEEHRHYPFEQKALLLPQVQSYLRPLTREFERRGIPFELDVKTPFGATGFGATLLALLRICLDEDAQASALTFVSSPYSGLSPDEALELDTRWRRYRTAHTSILSQLALHESLSCVALKLIRSYDMSARIGDWGSLITQLYAQGKQVEQSSFDLMQEAAAQKAAISVLQELYEQSLGEHTRQEQSSAAGELSLQAGAVCETEALAGDEDDAQPGRRILGFDPRIKAAEVYHALLEASVAQTPNPASPAVLIAEPSRVYGRRFHSVIAGGLSAADERISDDIPLDLRMTARLTGTQAADVGQQQELNHYSIIAAARKRLCLVAQSETLAGEKLKSGELLSSIENCLGAEICEKLAEERGIKSHDETIATQAQANEEKQEEIRKLLKGKAVPQINRPQHGQPAQYDFGYSAETSVSPTTLEDYAYCSYRWFLQRYARGKEIEYGFDLRVQGNFVHKVLKSFYENLHDSTLGKRITKDNLDTALELYEQVFHKEHSQLKEGLSLNAAEVAELVQIKQQLKNFLISEVNYAPEFIPTYFEYHFGGEGSKPLDLGIGLPLRGSIDRIDVREDDRAAIIIDYKRTANIGGFLAQANNKIMQGVLYRHAAAKTLNLRPVAHSYRSYTDSNKSNDAYAKEDSPPERPLGLPPVNFTQKTTDVYIERIMDAATQAAAGLSCGEVSIRDKSTKKCMYCIFEECVHYKKGRGGR